jgi:hypothetical protein
MIFLSLDPYYTSCSIWTLLNEHTTHTHTPRTTTYTHLASFWRSPKLHGPRRWRAHRSPIVAPCEYPGPTGNIQEKSWGATPESSQLGIELGWVVLPLSGFTTEPLARPQVQNELGFFNVVFINCLFFPLNISISLAWTLTFMTH